MLRAAALLEQAAPLCPPEQAAEMAATRSAKPSGSVFLTARWRNLAILNWEIDPDVLAPLVPPGVELDFHHGKTHVSMVGFQFLDARLLGLSIPFHRNFEEVNLRFYVLRRVGGQILRGVVFVKEICPRRAVSSVARWVYNEQYVTLPMRHRVTVEGAASPSPIAGSPLSIGSNPHPNPLPEGEGDLTVDVEYAWRRQRAWHRLSVQAHGAVCPPPAGSLEEFIIEHYWAYTRQRDGGCVEYRVAHRPWRVWPVRAARLSADVEPLYGRELAKVLRRPPTSAILADGSPVMVYRGVRM